MIDTDRCVELIELARSISPRISITFHRAFDEAADPIAAYDGLLGLGVERILTAGQGETAVAGSDVLRRLIAVAETGPGPAILPGGGVRPANAQALLELGVNELRSSATLGPRRRARSSGGRRAGRDRA